MKMKAVLWAAFLLLTATSALFAQTVFYEEDFEADPTDWEYGQNWEWIEDHLELYWNPIIPDYDMSAYSPDLQLPENVGELVVSQWLSIYEPFDEVIVISVVHNMGEDVLWSYQMAAGDWGEEGGEDLTLELSPYAGQEVQLRFRSYGRTTFSFNNWNIYNVTVYQAFDTDLAAVEVTGPTIVEQNSEQTWEVTVRNDGFDTISNFDVRLLKEGSITIGEIHSTDVLEFQDTQTYAFNWTPNGAEDTYLYGVVELEGDEWPGNDQTPVYEIMIYPQGAPMVLVWDNDRYSHYIDPDYGNITDCEDGIIEVLDDNQVPCVVLNRLPDDLTIFDVIAVELGLYCVS